MSSWKDMGVDLDSVQDLMKRFDDRMSIRSWDTSDIRRQVAQDVVSESGVRLSIFYEAMAFQLRMFLYDMLKSCPNLAQGISADWVTLLEEELDELDAHIDKAIGGEEEKRGIQELQSEAYARVILKIIRLSADHQSRVHNSFLMANWDASETAEAEA